MAREVDVPSAEPSNASPELAPLPMRPWERVASFLFGLGFGGAGVYAIFTTTNQVGSAALVIAGAAFSLYRRARHPPHKAR
jgi:hypothetical protein